jgi:hypothetical protein
LQLDKDISKEGQAMNGLKSGISIIMMILLLTVILVACLACNGITPNNSGDDIWTGKWDTGQWGEMTLQQNGSSVTGNYEWDSGKITGTVSGNILKGTWSESPTYQPENDAGDFEFTISSNGNSFTGRWRYGSSGDWDGN